MKNIIEVKKRRFYFQFLSILTILLGSILLTIARSNKLTILLSINEEILPYLRRISHVGALSEEAKNQKKRISQNIINLTRYIASFSFIKGETEKSKLLPLIEIEIPFNSMRKINRDRKRAIKVGYLKKGEWVNGTIKSEGKVEKVKIRLKGDLADHWTAHKRFSLRIETKNNNKSLNKPSILGMRTFSLHKLSSRQFPYEYIFQNLAKDIGQFSVNHNTVKVKLNGQYWGVMNMQEHFGSALLEKNKMRDSIIFSFTGGNNFAYRAQNGYLIPYKYYWLDNPRLFVNITGKSFRNLSSIQLSQYEYIYSKIKKNNYQDILFSKRHLAKAESMLKIWGNYHPLALHNAKFYLNPFTLKLQPLLSDQGKFGINEYENITDIATKGFLTSNEKFFYNKRQYEKLIIKSLRKYIPNYKLANDIFPDNKPLKIEDLDFNFKNLQYGDSILPNNYSFNKYSKTINCENSPEFKTSGFPTLQASIDKQNLLITPLVCGTFKIRNLKFCENKIPVNFLINKKTISIKEPSIFNIEINKLYPNKKCIYNGKISYDFNGQKKQDQLFNSIYIEKKENPLIAVSLPNFIKKNSNDDYFIKRGTKIVKKPIFVRGNLIIDEGVLLKFTPESYLIVEGSIQINGTKNNPSRMTSLDKNSFWKGIYVFDDSDNKQYSTIKNTSISNTKATNVGLLNLTGGITFYNSNLLIENLKIANTNSEDGINIVNSKVKINDLEITNAKSDGLDCDFCNGSINVNFLNDINGDGLDFSGSSLKVNINKAENIKDKVVSVGEESSTNIFIKEIKNSNIGAAVKDGSNALIRFNNIETLGPIIMTYIKKDFYTKKTKASVNINDNVFKNNKEKFLAQFETSLIINNEKIKESKINLFELYKKN